MMCTDELFELGLLLARANTMADMIAGMPNASHLHLDVTDMHFPVDSDEM